MVKYKELSHERFIECIDILCDNLKLYLNENDINGLGVSKTGICSWRGKTDNIIIDGKSDTKIV